MHNVACAYQETSYSLQNSADAYSSTHRLYHDCEFGKKISFYGL